MSSADDALSEAKQTLLRALESEMSATVQHVCVVYSVYKEDDEGHVHENGGWNHSTGPAWLIAAMLRRGADSIDASPYPANDDEED